MVTAILLVMLFAANKARKYYKKVIIESRVMILEEEDKSKVYEFISGEFFQYNMSLVAIDMINAGIRRKQKNQKLYERSSVKMEYRTSAARMMYDIVFQHVADAHLFNLAANALVIMEDEFFDEQPSVNLKKGRLDNLTIVTTKTSYEEFSKINLLEHTKNLLVVFDEFTKSGANTLNDKNNEILLLSCIFHDFGKSILLAKKLGIYEKGMEDGFYKHNYVSEEMVQMIAESVDKTIFTKNKEHSYQLGRIKNIVFHHHKDRDSVRFDDKDDLVPFLIKTDKKAREREQIELKKINMSNKEAE